MSIFPDPSTTGDGPSEEAALLRRAEAALAACEARYRTLFDYAQVGVVLADAESYYLDANAAACRMLGYSREELIGLHASDIVAQAEVENIGSALTEIHGQADHQREWRFRRKDGSVFPADVVATRMPDGSLLGLIRDLTDSRRADAYRERLAAIVESSQDAIMGHDLEGRITSWNAGAEINFGYTAAEMMGRSITRIIPDDRLEEERQLLERLRIGERVAHLETLRRNKDGRLIDVSIAAAPIRDPEGRIIGASRIARDITTLKDREREIARLSRLYAALSQINQAIVWTSDRDELFRKICRVLVEHGGFHMAWIGWDDPATHRLWPVAEFGDENGYLKSITVYTDDRPEGRGPSGTAFRTGRPYICNEMLQDPATQPWRAELGRRGLHSSAAFPIRVAGEVRGVLSVYAEPSQFFHHKEVELLEEAATDLSFALDNFAREEARREAEDMVRREKLFTDTMIESNPGIFYLYDRQGRFLRWNQSFEDVSGYSGAEIAAMRPHEFFLEEDRPRVRERIAEVFEEGESSVEAAFRAKDGSSTPYFFTGRRIEFQDYTCLVGVGIDISERIRAEQALREAELRFHTLFEQTPVGVAVLDPADGAILECNEQAARQLGYSQPELCELSIADLEASGTREGARRHIEQVLREGRDEYETQHRSRSGETREVFVTARLLELTGRTVIHCVFVDITERKRAEDQIRESEAHLVEAQRIAGIGSWELDLRTHHLRWSKQVSEIFGIQGTEFASTYDAFLEFVHPADRESLERAQQAAMAGEARLDLQHRIVLRDGGEKVVHELADLRRDESGRPVSLAGTVHDVTDRARIEAEREKRLQAEAADRIKSSFLATMSHELRTPLNSIIGFTGIILQGLAGPLNSEQSKQLDMVRGSARHLLALVNDVLDISKIEAGQLDVAREPFDLRRSITRVLALVTPQAEAKQLRLRVLLDPSLGAAVSDERRFEQILLNLLSNAIKFTDRGEVELSAELTADFRGAAEASPGQPAIRLRVIDTGIGIRAEDLPSLFEPFRQLDSGLSRNHEGTGLGLAICGRLVALMGGEISVESEIGKGSRFTVTLPLQGRIEP